MTFRGGSRLNRGGGKSGGKSLEKRKRYPLPQKRPFVRLTGKTRKGGPVTIYLTLRRFRCRGEASAPSRKDDQIGRREKKEGDGTRTPPSVRTGGSRTTFRRAEKKRNTRSVNEKEGSQITGKNVGAIPTPNSSSPARERSFLFL